MEDPLAQNVSYLIGKGRFCLLKEGRMNMKPFKTLDEQIALLESRGLTIPDHDKAKHYLLQYSYYNVINVYSRFFQIDTDRYIDGTTFDEIRAVHVFDSEIKSVFFKYLLECEKHLKSIVSYRFSEAYPDVPYAYLHTTSYDDHNLLNLSTTVSQLSKIISQNIKNKKPNAIKHYSNNHQNVPIWVLINQLTFGQVVYMYTHFDNKLRNAIARDVTHYLENNTGKKIILEPIELERLLFNLLDLRNCVAHNNMLFNFKSKNNVKYIPEIHEKNGIEKKSPRQDPFNCFLMMQGLIEKEQYALFSNTIRKRIRNLNNKLVSVPVETITSSLGFPSSWYRKAPLEQPK